MQPHRSFLVSNSALGVKLKLWEQAAENLNTLDISTRAPCLWTFPTPNFKLLLVAWNLNLILTFFFHPTGRTLCLSWNILPLGLVIAFEWSEHTQGDCGLEGPLVSGYPAEPDVFLMQSSICNRRSQVDPLWLFFLPPSKFNLHISLEEAANAAC